MTARAEDMAGQRFGMLVVLARAANSRWLCRCDCGREVLAPRYRLVQGVTVSCGHPVRHGHAGDGCSAAYISWAGMIQRCRDPHCEAWPRYGGRGIKVCDRWLRFGEFLADMGERPPGTSLDRYPDNDGNYEPGNCRWATATEQNGNRRNNVRVTLGGKTATVAEWARSTGLPEGTIRNRLRYGWPPERVLWRGDGRLEAREVARLRPVPPRPDGGTPEGGP